MYFWNGIRADFIVSTGRTGTVFLAQLLDEITRDVDVRHEPTVDVQGSLHQDLFELGMAYAQGKMSPESALGLLQRERYWILRELRAKKCDWYVEANPFLATLIPPLLLLFPAAAIVHIVRDGRDVVRSWFSKQINSRDKEIPAYFMDENDSRRRLHPQDLPSDLYYPRAKEMSRFELLCWLWVTTDRAICDSLENHSRTLRIKYEDIFDPQSNHVGFDQILSFLELTPRIGLSQPEIAARMTVRQNKTSRHKLGGWDDWTDEQKACFTEIAGEHMQRCGYEITT